MNTNNFFGTNLSSKLIEDNKIEVTTPGFTVHLDLKKLSNKLLYGNGDLQPVERATAGVALRMLLGQHKSRLAQKQIEDDIAKDEQADEPVKTAVQATDIHQELRDFATSVLLQLQTIDEHFGSVVYENVGGTGIYIGEDCVNMRWRLIGYTDKVRKGALLNVVRREVADIWNNVGNLRNVFSLSDLKWESDERFTDHSICLPFTNYGRTLLIETTRKDPTIIGSLFKPDDLPYMEDDDE